MSSRQIPNPLAREAMPYEVPEEWLGPHWATAPRRLQFRSPLVEQTALALGPVGGWNERRLTPAEQALARRVFQAAIIIDAVRVITASIANAPTTAGNYVRVPAHDGHGFAYRPDAFTLVHELTRLAIPNAWGRIHIELAGGTVLHGGARRCVCHSRIATGGREVDL